MLGTARLLGRANKNPTITNYLLGLFGGIATFLFEPVVFVLFTNELNDGGAIPVAIQIASTIFGIYFIVIAIKGIVKIRKLK